MNIDFIGIGSGKSGSTWLFNNICKHPEICNKNPKELRYFDLQYEKKPLKWYLNHFKDCNKLLKGEFSVQYMYCADAAIRIHKHFPQVKLLAILRKPENRIYSDYLHSIRKGEYSSNSSFDEFISHESNLEVGYYYKFLKPFYELFDSQQIKIIILEKIEDNEAYVLQDLYNFLDVENKSYLPCDLKEKVNEAFDYKALWIEQIMTKTSKNLNDHGLNMLVERLKRTGIANLIRRLNRKGKSEQSIPEHALLKLKEVYREHNEKLEDLTGYTLTEWKV